MVLPYRTFVNINFLQTFRLQAFHGQMTLSRSSIAKYLIQVFVKGFHRYKTFHRSSTVLLEVFHRQKTIYTPSIDRIPYLDLPQTEHLALVPISRRHFIGLPQVEELSQVLQRQKTFQRSSIRSPFRSLPHTEILSIGRRRFIGFLQVEDLSQISMDRKYYIGPPLTEEFVLGFNRKNTLSQSSIG